jgi:hypothetical protein
MTDDRPPDALAPDEVASAALDGEITPGEQARIDSDPALRARVAELRAVRDQVAAPVPALSPARRQEILRRAGDAFDAAGLAPVVPLTHRRRTSRLVRVLAPVAAAAAAIAGVAFLVRDGDGGDDDAGVAVESEATASATEAADVFATERTTAAEAEAAAGGAAETTAIATQAADEAAAATEAQTEEAGAPTYVIYLGELSTPEEVAARLGDLAGATSPSRAAEDAVSRYAECPAPLTITAALTYRGQAALVVVRPDGALVIVSTECSVLDEVPPNG